jgi:AAA+ superfamily predicted ATPase
MDQPLAAPRVTVSHASSAVNHTLTHLARLDLLLRREVLRQRLLRPKAPDDEFRGLYISEDDVEGLLADTRAAASILAPALQPNDGLSTLDGAIAGLTARLREQEDVQCGDPTGSPVVRLRQLFDLTEFERDLLIVCLAAELDLKYERLYAYLQDDVTKKRPTVDLLLRLLCPTLEARLAARRSFGQDAPLLRWNLITLNDDPGSRRPVLLARYLKLDERIADYLAGTGDGDARLAPLAATSSSEGVGRLPPDVRLVLDRWGAAWEATWHGTAPLMLFQGRYGTGKRAAASYLAALLGRPLLQLNASDLAASDLPATQIFRLAEREALLTGAVLAWSDVSGLLQPQPGSDAEQRAFLRALAQGRVPTILLSEKAWEPARDLAGRPFLRLELPETTYAQRRDHWLAGLDGQTINLSTQHADALAGRFRLTSGQISDAIGRARALAWTRDPQNGHLSDSDIDAACRAQAQHRLSTLARKLNPRYTWDDLVLPRPQLTTLRLIGATVRHRPVVYGDWGFDRKLSMGKGLIALFAGPSGTGKTMAAEVIATDLGLDLYKIDLATVVSKYIGETEKNLDRIFSEAQESDAILFFDEADALFGKRSEVKDAHDRYANIETAYLLQRTEEYDGVVILASNLKKNLDEAFVRRLHFLIEFPVPEEAERLAIWRRTFPAATPRADDVDLPFLARKLKIAGGNIRNIILTAAFLAAEDRQPVSMRHLVRAAGYELQKMGKLLVEADFEHYLVLARG